jgi:hypothetical protein
MDEVALPLKTKSLLDPLFTGKTCVCLVPGIGFCDRLTNYVDCAHLLNSPWTVLQARLKVQAREKEEG